MPDKHSLADRLYYANRREYTDRQGNVAYLDGSPLRRSLSLAGGQRATVAVIAIIALIIGIVFMNVTVLSSMREAMAAEQAVSDNLSRQASLDTVPVMTDLVELDDDELKAKFEGEGFVVFDATELADSDDMILYKLPADVSTEEAAAMLSSGISSLDAAQATRLLNGSWYFSTERSGQTSMVVRYADFTTGDPQAALSAALEKEGFDPTAINETGEDESGNTYSMGVVDVGKKSYTWKISALPLSDMYAVKNLPEEACYVGVRLTAQ